jgi:hypothetical protein
VDQRLLVTEERRGTRRIELTHDILTGVARLSRDQRREREDKAKAAMDAEAASERELAQHRQLRRSRQLTTAYAGLALVAGIAFIYGFSKQREANTTLGDIKYKKALIAIKNEVTERENAEHTETLTKYRSLLVKAAISDCLVAENELQAGHVHEALAHLARACEFDPDSTLAREKAVMALYHYPRPKNHSVWYGCDLTNAEFSPNGKYVVTVSADQTAKVWDIATDQEIATLTGHGVTVTSALFSPNGVRIVTISNDQTARVWDAMTGNILVTYEGGVTGVRFSPDGSCIVTASSDQTARVWDASTGKNIATTEGIEGGVMCAQFSLEDKLIVTVSRDQTAQVWDAVTGIKSNTFTWHVKKLMSAEFNSDGTRMVTTADDQTASVWAIPEPIVVVKMVHGESQTVLEWPSSTIKLLMNLTGHRNNLRSAHFSRDGTRIVTASDDNTVRVWNAGTGKCIGTLAGQSGGVLSARFSQDCARIVTASADQTIRVWDVLPSGAGQTPEWFADFLRYMAQRQFNADGELETLKPDGLRVIQASLRAELLNGSSKDKHYLSVLRRWVPE